MLLARDVIYCNFKNSLELGFCNGKYVKIRFSVIYFINNANFTDNEVHKIIYAIHYFEDV